MPPFVQQVRGVTMLTIYMTGTLSNLSVAKHNLHIHSSVYKTKTHRLKRSDIFFYPERDKALLNKSLP